MTRTGLTFRRRLRAAILGACLAAGVSLFATVPAEAVQWTPHTFEKSISGWSSGSSVAVDQQSGDFYVLTTEPGLNLYKFDAQGEPTAFSDPSLGGATVINMGATEECSCSPDKVMVDNSGGPHQGRIYVENSFIDEHVWAFEPSGAPVGGNFPLEAGPEDMAISPVTGNFFLTGTPLLERAYEYNQEGVKTGTVIDLSKYGSYKMEISPDGDFYTYSFNPSGIQRINTSGELVERLYAQFSSAFNVNPISGNVLSAREEEAAEYDPNGNELPRLEYEYEGYPNSVAVNGVNGYIYVLEGYRLSILAPQAPVTVPSAENEPASEIHGASMKLHASVEPEGVTTTKCVFEYGTTEEYGYIYYEGSAPCEQGEAISGSSPTSVSATISGLTQGATYHTRLAVGNANGTFHTRDAKVITSEPPVVENPYIDNVHTDSVEFHAEISPEGAPTTFHVLYGTADCATEPDACSETPESSSIGSGLLAVKVSAKVTGLQPGTAYHYMFVATNQSASTDSADATFITFPYTPVLEDPCPNAHVRQQTSAALLPDCRAYELVSAGYAGGYDVESFLNAEQEPFGGYPYAENPPRALYGVHDGAIPGSGHPTNHGLDPYVATRGENGWSTSYVGIPANLPYSAESFASPLAGADASLDTFAFGGADLCSPCFADGTTGVPVTLPNGSLVQGMAGSEHPGTGATASMLVKKPLSADGKHLIFGSDSEFELGSGSPAIYDRNLTTDVTHAVSKLPGGGSIPCLMDCSSDGLAELDVSGDGSRIVIGQLVSTDAAGNRYWHLYMNIGDSGQTIDLTPGASEGALYDGMTTDGSMVYFTTKDQLRGEDTDSSADIYRADVSPSGASLSLVSTGSGGSGNSESCEPLADSQNEHWNSTDSAPNCDAVAVGGGGGVAAADGSIYFLSPELLDGSAEPEDGVANQPNLYISRPGSAAKFVATLESSATGPTPPLEEHRFEKYFGASSNTQFVAVDNSGGPSDGDVYVVNRNEQVIRKYDSEGNLITSWQNNGEFDPELAHEIAGIAVGGPAGALYVAIDEEYNSGNRVFEYDEEGDLIAANFVEKAPEPIGIAVDSQGNVFYEGYGVLMRWKKGKGSTEIAGGAYNSPPPTGVAVNPTTGTLYVSYGGTEISRYVFTPEGRVIEPSGECASRCEPTSTFGAGEVSNASGMFVDPTRGELYVDEGNKILRFEGDGTRAPGPDIGVKKISNSTSVALSSSTDLYATNAGSEGANVAAFGPIRLAPDPRTDNPLVLDSVNEAGARRTGDFQITPNGNKAVFVSTIPYTGQVTGRQEEVFLSASPGGTLDCVSCNPTNAKAVGAASLARDGLSLTGEGKVFFNSTDVLSPRDLDNREDVYEWENGKTSLISTGLSPFDTTLLSASANGTDAYFFTRDTLAPQDRNGSLVKLYDAREDGGFPYTPPPVSCKASDECHGPGTQAAPPPSVGTITGTRGNHVSPAQGLKCRHGFVKRHGRCVKRHKRRHDHHRHHHRHGKKKRSGEHGRGGKR